jgi:hypothetical protein
MAARLTARYDSFQTWIFQTGNLESQLQSADDPSARETRKFERDRMSVRVRACPCVFVCPHPSRLVSMFSIFYSSDDNEDERYGENKSTEWHICMIFAIENNDCRNL